uniref:Uncharacterized protein n=1 Tax=viral metagenome TaxID=1070528 RepID=A0A6M3KD37_9ZZZZ
MKKPLFIILIIALSLSGKTQVNRINILIDSLSYRVDTTTNDTILLGGWFKEQTIRVDTSGQYYLTRQQILGLSKTQNEQFRYQKKSINDQVKFLNDSLTDQTAREMIGRELQYRVTDLGIINVKRQALLRLINELKNYK